MKSLRDAASFLTRVPLHRDDATANMSAAVPWFGVVGLVIGAVQGGAYVGLVEVVSPLLAALLSTALAGLITGAFHHDGLADMADAFGGGWTREQRLEILNDSRLGTYGVTSLIFVIGIEVAALASLTGLTAFCGAVIAHGLSRSTASVTMLVARPAQESGLGVDYLRGLSRPAVAIAVLLMIVITSALFGIIAAAIVVAAAIAATAVVRLAMAKIGGISGDILGAVQQIAKLAILVTIVIAATNLTDPGSLYGLAL